ncbi:2-oxopent-4-enoate hydratase [Naumannella sp. ID2617S]|uniref:2-oxopent-4-enoate hydratase n=1 Tax=Enemella dayhoffiae TaxID=2016507 RepID=A0A255GN63_9ACTN|nr:2-keto-4-pentenoate hydratase [Enemella dayhoffiae]NNG21195.1 2-oxopent-4-enoate hydratase [Naumannella sp. ID2617S]OYO17255.1 2-oxopent-4-enoate hydratase [Enemella dayhoffiae]
MTDRQNFDTERSQQHQQLADALLAAYRTKQPIQPLREQLSEMTVEDAYAIQQLQEQKLLADGGTLIGRKIGLTSLAMQKALGVDSPDFGFMFDDDRFIGHEDAHFNSKDFIQPKIEPEFAFVLKKDLTGPGVTLADAVDAIDTVHMAIEIIDSRVADWNIKLVDTVADNASYGAIAWSEQALKLDKDDLPIVQCTLTVDGEVVGSGTGADVMGHPAGPLQWLANTLGERGVPLKAGQVVLPGSFCAAAVVEAGSTATADYGDLGSFTIHFD